ncbi:hypothetical protein GDO78_014261 [Eleutherodactylus coqui]|uniref:Uncharacterized protein n=1 Tax=Eleutherodactylus coqui TaxID=57060 RepID=A0A8J6JL26_ELECQ|nr:hypothetical protein GDO78_014261 [Eleutherodactylus coqui]
MHARPRERSAKRVFNQQLFKMYGQLYMVDIMSRQFSCRWFNNTDNLHHLTYQGHLTVTRPIWAKANGRFPNPHPNIRKEHFSHILYKQMTACQQRADNISTLHMH